MMATMSSHKTTIRITCKQPVQTKVQVRHAFTEFSLLHESIETDYGHEIDVITGETAKTVLLKRLAGAGADPHKVAMLQLTGAPNEFLQMQQEERDRLKGITNEVEKSPDVLL